MGRDNTYSTKVELLPKERKMHPVWRGVGFALIIILPAISYVASLLLIEANKVEHWFSIPLDLYSKGNDPYATIKLVLTLIIFALFSIIFTTIFMILYSIFGPSRYGPTDVPPVGGRFKKYKR